MRLSPSLGKSAQERKSKIAGQYHLYTLERKGAQISAEQAVELLFNPRITLAGGGFQTKTIEDSDPATTVADQSRLLKDAGNQIDTGAAHAQHLGEELLGEQILV